MVARSKITKAKWGVDKDKPEDLPDFLSNDEIAEKEGGHPRGNFRLKFKGIPTIVKNSSDNDMIKFMLVIDDPRKEKSGYNGYACWENQNVTDQSKPFLLKWLKGLGTTWDTFWNNSKITPATTIDPSQLMAIGDDVNFNAKKPVFVEAVLGKDNRPDYDNSRIVRWIPKDEAGTDDEELDEDADAEVEDDDTEVETDADGDPIEPEMGDEEAELREELETLTLTELKNRIKENAKELEEEVPKLVGKKAPALIDIIVEQEVDAAEESEDEDADAAEEELREELSDKTLAALKARCKKNGRKLADYRKVTDPDELIEMIVEDELGSEDDNEPPF